MTFSLPKDLISYHLKPFLTSPAEETEHLIQLYTLWYGTRLFSLSHIDTVSLFLSELKKKPSYKAFLIFHTQIEHINAWLTSVYDDMKDEKVLSELKELYTREINNHCYEYEHYQMVKDYIIEVKCLLDKSLLCLNDDFNIDSIRIRVIKYLIHSVQILKRHLKERNNIEFTEEQIAELSGLEISPLF